MPEDPRAASAVAWRRLRAAFLSLRRTQFLVALTVCLVALAVVMQIRSQAIDEVYGSARRSDLVQLVDGLSSETRRLEREMTDLESTRRELETGQDARRVAQQQAQGRLDTLSVLAGTAPARGPGVRITIHDPKAKIGPSILLDALGEMRDAGGEVMEVNDQVRVAADTWVGGTPGALVVDGQRLAAPIVIEVIGNAHSLEEAARFRGGLVSEVTAPQVGGRIDIVQVGDLDVRSVRTPERHQFARPVR